MTLKSKLIATISAFCLVVGMLIAGVWASLHVQVELGGDLVFTATDVNVKVSGKIEGMETTEESGVMTLPTITFSANPDENSPSTVLDQWKNNALTFTQAGDDITITITIENLNDRVVNVKVKDSVGASAGVDKIIKNGTTLESVAEVASGAEVSLNGNSITYYTITLSLKDRNNSLATGVKYGYTIDLSDESFKVETPVFSNDESLGTATYEIVDSQLRLIATPATGTNSIFVGWRDDSTNEFITYNNLTENKVVFLSAFMSDESNPLIGLTNMTYVTSYFVDDSLITVEEKNVDSIKTLLTQFEESISSGSIAGKQAEECSNYIYDMYARCDTQNVCYSYMITDYVEGNTYTAMFISKENIKPYEDSNLLGETYTGRGVALATVSQIIGSSNVVEIPDTLNGNKVIDLKGDTLNGESIVKNTNLQSITIASGIQTIPNNAFSGCTTLTEVIFAENSQLKSIGNDGFRDCTGLTSVLIPDGVVSIGNQAFGYCSNLKYVTLPSNVESIGQGAFMSCNSTIVIMADNPPSLQSHIGGSGSHITCFVPDASVSLYIENGNYGSSVYSLESKLEDENLVYHIKEDNTLEVVTIKNQIEKLEIPLSVEDKNVTEIGAYALAFGSCTTLTSVIIPSSVIKIGYGVFNGCRNLTEITILATTPPSLSRSNSIPSSVINIYVPDESLATYQEYCNNSTNGWSSSLLAKLKKISEKV